ncbi:hypothetical protein [Absidia glauca]|uniref:Uncharacterized protein n=1 Tax=Absidia glauca TaxID=4829 RepID=A0A163JHR7_ABSGL|nr:hypothetical protein [Absidia glauca]
MASSDSSHWLFDAPRYYDFTKSEEENNHTGDAWFDKRSTSTHYSLNTTMETIQQPEGVVTNSIATNDRRSLEPPSTPPSQVNAALEYHYPVNYTADAYLHSPSQRRNHSQGGSRRRNVMAELKKKTRIEQTQHLNDDSYQQQHQETTTPVDHTQTEGDRSTTKRWSLLSSSAPMIAISDPLLEQHEQQTSPSYPTTATREYTTDQQDRHSSLRRSPSIDNAIEEPIEQHSSDISDRERGPEALEHQLVKLPILGRTIKPVPEPTPPRATSVDYPTLRKRYSNNNNTEGSDVFPRLSLSTLRSQPDLDHSSSSHKKLHKSMESTNHEHATETNDHPPKPNLTRSPHQHTSERVPSTPRKRPHSPELDDHQTQPLKAAKVTLPDHNEHHPTRLLQLIAQVKSHRRPAAESPLLQLIARIRSHQKRPFTPPAPKLETVFERARRVINEANYKSMKWIVPQRRRTATGNHRLSTHLARHHLLPPVFYLALFACGVDRTTKP